MKLIKAETGISVLMTISLFAIMLFSYNKWQSKQTRLANFLYQQQQALQIAENQIALKMANRECERLVKQNNLLFTVQCNHSFIKVIFPLGEIKVGNP
ncbi:hypothetical protein A6B43_04745 [Vespertiliibacter pulmonis]|uniref:Prepilin peptidase dependent protein C n=1 Tax=Vespertiliibacter pulmonis TaxID=1443036 RepID=A0A3N4VQE3_9PAST|nr:DUF5374 domain-containing protein [Vespertiliibacter pulmonis]QLB20882.1 hypothetical protein A6B43_04745 [Vespertiliibacter pulmonis]RPE83535.1 prepilin peptidase dependent protein C [Vespertiliibacter pulmonis]